MYNLVIVEVERPDLVAEKDSSANVEGYDGNFFTHSLLFIPL